MSGVDDPANWTGSSGESPPTCFNLFDSDGYFWSDDTGGPDFQIHYSGDPVDNPFFVTSKVINPDPTRNFNITCDAGGDGSISTNVQCKAADLAQFDFGLPISSFTIDFGIVFVTGMQIGVKFSPDPPPPPPPPPVVVIPTDFVAFPACPSYGFNAQPQYLVKINPRDGGFERVDKRWTRPLSVYTAVPIGERDEADVQAILNFWHALGGRATSFLIKDWTDFKSCPVQSAVSAVDQPVETVTLLDSTTAYQLTKVYTVGSLTQIREITQPVASTVIVANESGVVQTDYTLDESSGLLKPGSDFTGTPTSWGGEFNVPVRFDSELSMQVVDKQIQSVTFTLREKRIALANTFPGSP